MSRRIRRSPTSRKHGALLPLLLFVAVGSGTSRRGLRRARLRRNAKARQDLPHTLAREAAELGA